MKNRKALVFFWPPIKSFQRPDPQFHRRPARIVKKLISGNFARSEKYPKINGKFKRFENIEEFFWKLEILHALKKVCWQYWRQ